MEMTGQSLVVTLTEQSEVGVARRSSLELAQKIGLTEADAGRVGLVATEMSTNLVKHAQQGVLLIRPLTSAGGPGVELLAIDKGPGMRDVPRCMADGFSTSGSPGTGLGAISRMSDLFDLYSHDPSGTAMVAQIRPRNPIPAPLAAIVGSVCVAKSGETVSGDDWLLVEEGARTVLLVVDGLGHGEYAARAAREATRTFRENAQRPVREIVDSLHGALRSTRGASAAAIELNSLSEEARYTGIGNIAARIQSDTSSRSLISHNGTLGHEVRRTQDFNYSWPSGALLVMHSDGIQSRWNLDPYPGIMTRHPSLIAGVLFRDFARGSDDATVVVVRNTPQRR